MIRIWFKATCSTCRTALSLLKENTSEEIILTEYLVQKPSKKDIREVLKFAGLKAEEIVRKKEALYKNKYSKKKYSNIEWIDILVKHPELIERPIVIRDGKAIIGRPPERILDLLE